MGLSIDDFTRTHSMRGAVYDSSSCPFNVPLPLYSIAFGVTSDRDIHIPTSGLIHSTIQFTD